MLIFRNDLLNWDNCKGGTLVCSDSDSYESLKGIFREYENDQLICTQSLEQMEDILHGLFEGKGLIEVIGGLRKINQSTMTKIDFDIDFFHLRIFSFTVYGDSNECIGFLFTLKIPPYSSVCVYVSKLRFSGDNEDKVNIVLGDGKENSIFALPSKSAVHQIQTWLQGDNPIVHTINPKNRW